MTRDKIKLKLMLISLAAVAVIVAAAFCVKRYMPTSKKMSGYDYFDVASGTSDVMVILDGQQINDMGRYEDNRLYMLQSFVEDEINLRFYYDKESNSVLYALTDTIYTFYPDIKGYQDTKGNTYDTDYDVVKMINGQMYIDFEHVASVSNIHYTYAEAPARVVIFKEYTETSYVTVEKVSPVRYRAGIKSKVLEKMEAGTTLTFVEKIDEDWSCVITPSGYRGYIKNSAVSDIYTSVLEDTYIDEYTDNVLNYKVNMAWFQVTQRAANNYIDDYLANTSGINTISPTWYSISDVSGELDSLASEEFVNKMHRRGINVWPLINDFNKDIDYEVLYSSKAARTALIDNLMQEAVTYRYDGYNIDFEYIKKEFAQDYLQFLRELSIACQDNGLILSVDNYKPASHNTHYHIEEQAVFVDYIIIMGYDEHYSGSDAGSVASLPFVEEGIQRAVDMVPSRQVINAIPFYTRIWTESAEGTKSRAVGIQAALDNLKQNNGVALWDEAVGQYYCSYETTDGVVKIWFEEDRSIGEKMKLYKKYQLGGVAEWKLGLETSSVWSIISSGLDY